MMRARIALAAAVLPLCALARQTSAQEVLDIAPVYQQTPVWCWAAVGEMVFDWFGVRNINPAGNYQCGIIALLHPICNMNCFNCPVPAGSLATMNNMLRQYPAFASQVTQTSTQITTAVSATRLSMASVRREIDAGRPIVTGISPSGYQLANVSEHVALIVGYDEDDLIVNDPFPFALAFSGNPYLAAGGEELDRGQYQISYEAFVQRLRWRETIYRLRCSGSGCLGADGDQDDAPVQSATGRSCQTPYGRCGPFYDQPALPLGSACYCASPAGPIGGVVVR